MSGTHFRRFTYQVNGNFQDTRSVSLSVQSEKIKTELDRSGILTLEIYQKDETHFIVIDTEVSFNSQKLFDKFQRTRALNHILRLLPQHDKALERIYKLEQKTIFPGTEGQLKTSVAPYKRFVWTLSLAPSLIDEYKRVHSMGQAWPEITANMKSVGVKDMEIYLSGIHVFLVMDTIPGFNLEEVGPRWQQLPREAEWQRYVAQFQKTDPDSSIQEKWKDMKLIASIGN